MSRHELFYTQNKSDLTLDILELPLPGTGTALDLGAAAAAFIEQKGKFEGRKYWFGDIHFRGANTRRCPGSAVLWAAAQSVDFSASTVSCAGFLVKLRPKPTLTESLGCLEPEFAPAPANSGESGRQSTRCP